MANKDEEQFDPWELGARNSDPTLGALQPLPPAPRRFKPVQLLFAFLGLVVFIAFVQEGTGRNVPQLPASCTTPSFAFDKTEVKQGGVVKWSAVGPADHRIVFAIDTPTLPTTAEQGKLFGPAALTDCGGTGRFGVQRPEGEHVLSAFLIAPDGTVTSLGTRPLTVADP